MGEAGEYTAAGDIPFNREVQLDGITEKEAGELYKVLKRFMKAYHEKDPECSDLEWLEECYRRELPEWEEEQTARLAGETLSGIREYGQGGSQTGDILGKMAGKEADGSRERAFHK